MPGVVRNGSSYASLGLAKCLGQDYDIDLVSLRITGTEFENRELICPPFSSVKIVDPDNCGGIFRRAFYRLFYGVKAVVLDRPREVFYESGAGLKRVIREMVEGDCYSLVVLEYWTSAELLKLDLGIPKVLYLHDAAWLSGSLCRGRGGWLRRRLSSYSRERLRRYELAAAGSADHVFFLSDRDLELYREQGFSGGGYIPLQCDELPGQHSSLAGRKVCFLGRFEYAPNLDALLWLVREIFPLVHKRVPEAELHVIGPGLDDGLKRELSRRGVKAAGWVDDLASYFAAMSVGVAPIRVGTGVNVKVLEQMQYGVPMVVSEVAASGTPARCGGAIVGRTADEIAAGIVELLEDKAKATELRKIAWRELSEKHCGQMAKQSVIREFSMVLGAG